MSRLIIFISILLSVTKAQIPFKANALVWLDGKIGVVGSDTILLDKSGNGRHFKITNVDFTIDNSQKGFPYKTAAIISAPIGDATLMAADVDSFFYTSSGPNQIPVVSLFQDIDYAHKIFTRHVVQVIDEDSVEVRQPYVQEVVFYNTVKTGTDLSKCNNYFRVPAEMDSTQAVWISPFGNDATGTGTKTFPWKTWDKVKGSSKHVYVGSGIYTLTANTNMTGSAINVIGTGYSRLNVATFSLRWQKTAGSIISGIIDDNNNSSATTYSQTFDNAVTFNRCKLGKSNSTAPSWGFGFTLLTGLTFNNCIFNCASGTTYGLFRPSATTTANYKMNGCYGAIGVGFTGAPVITNAIFSYNKFTNFGHRLVTTNIYAINNNVNTNFVFGQATNYYIIRNNVIDGKLGISSANNPVIKWNYVNAALSNATTEKVAFQVTPTGTYVGGDISYNNFIGSAIVGYISHIASLNGSNIYYNRFENKYVGTGTGHTVYIQGIDYSVKWNEIISSNGHGIVAKSFGVHYTDTTQPHIAYNIFKFTGYSGEVIWVRGAWGVRFANNTAIGFQGLRIYALDDDNSGADNSLTCVNNLITLGGSGATYTNGGAIVFMNNGINLNGFASPTIPATDFVTTVAIDARGVPATKIQNAVSLASGNNIGLASDYIIPTKPTFQTQTATWQNGAVIIQ